MPAKYALFLALLVFLPVSVGISCRGKESDGGKEASRNLQEGPAEQETSAGAPDTLDTSGRPERALSFGNPDGENVPQNKQDSAGTAADSGAGGEEPKDLSRRRPFFEYLGMETHYPVDLVIGRLQEPPETGSEEKKVLDLLERWLASISGEVVRGGSDDMYTGESSRILQNRLEGSEYRIEKVRFGKIRFETGTARLDIRLFSDMGRTQGELILRLEEKGWRIQAVDLDFSSLEQAYVPPDYEKNPPVYGTMQM